MNWKYELEIKLLSNVLTNKFVYISKVSTQMKYEQLEFMNWFESMLNDRFCTFDWNRRKFQFYAKLEKNVFCLCTYRTTCLWRSTQYLIALRTIISCFLLKPLGLAKFGGTLKVPPHSAFGTKTFPFSSLLSSSA